jgi:hypothetical protein
LPEQHDDHHEQHCADGHDFSEPSALSVAATAISSASLLPQRPAECPVQRTRSLWHLSPRRTLAS